MARQIFNDHTSCKLEEENAFIVFNSFFNAEK